MSELEMVECPEHGGGFDCTPFCKTCEGEQGYYPNIRCNDCMSKMYLEDTDTRDDCPDCGTVGCLMDLQGVVN